VARSGSRTGQGCTSSYERSKAHTVALPQPAWSLLLRAVHVIAGKFDREGWPRTAYSLPHTYICLGLLEGAGVYQIAKNCRTTIEMIEKYYASRIKTNFDAAINIRRAETEKNNTN
jgi:hypothetical protein